MEKRKCKCERCGYEWNTILDPLKVRTCPKCKSYYWREKRKKDKLPEGYIIGTQFPKNTIEIQKIA